MAWANHEDTDQMLQNMASDQSTVLPLIKQFVGTQIGKKMDFFKY